MEGGIPLIGLNRRCVVATVSGLASLEESRALAGQVYRFIVASGGELFDHDFLQRMPPYGLRIWACREDPVGFVASLRAALRCLVDTPERLLAATLTPRVQVSVALAPVHDPVSPLILGVLASGTDVWQLARELCAVASADPLSVSPERSALLVSLLELRVAETGLEAHLRRVLLGLGLPEDALCELLDGVVAGVPSARCG